MTIEGWRRYFIKDRDNYIIVSHDGPDADGLGAAYALALALGPLGKRPIAAVSERIPPKFAFIDRRGLFTSLAEPGSLPFPAAEATPDHRRHPRYGLPRRTIGEPDRGRESGPRHRPSRAEDRGQATTWFLDPTASSSCEMVFYLVKALGSALPLDAAEAIFAGIVLRHRLLRLPQDERAHLHLRLRAGAGGGLSLRDAQAHV